MASTDKPNTEAGNEEGLAPVAAAAAEFHLVDVVLRVLLFMATLTAIVVIVTSNQTERVPVPGLPITISRAAKFNYSPAFIYFVVAMCVACLYSIITTLASLSLISKPRLTKIILLNFALLDVLMLGIVASATGTAGGVAYIGLKGNSHSRWNKICTLYDKYCRHLGASIAVSLIAAILLLLLSMLSTLALYRRIRD